MYETICRTVVKNGAQLVYVTNRALAKALSRLEADFAFLHSEACLNEKIAYELALAGSYASKRTACIFTAEGIYDALDPVMSSAYTGVLGGFVVVCLKETDEEILPLGPFSKLPVIVARSPGSLESTLGFAYGISGKYEIPVLVQVNMEGGKEGNGKGVFEDAKASAAPSLPSSMSRFVKDPGRWAATPKFRYELHKKLNEKVEAIREEFETYAGNEEVRRGKTGLLTCGSRQMDIYDDDWSELKIATVFPLPRRRVDNFVRAMDQVFLSEGPYPVMRLQLESMERIVVEPFFLPPDRKKQDETIGGFKVVRDWLGPASALNMAHGMKKSEPDEDILAVTFEEHFLNAGMPAFVNSLYNGSSYVTLLLTTAREDEIRRLLKGFGFTNCHHIGDASEIERFRQRKEPAVLFLRGFL